MSEELRIAEAFPPGEYLNDELEARGWARADLAEITNTPPSVISDIIVGRRSISPELAHAFGEAFGTGAEVWLKIQARWQLAQTEAKKDEAIIKRAKLYGMAPVREMVKRGWIANSANVDVFETNLCRFFGIKNIADPIEMAHAARISGPDNEVNPAQLAWLTRARNLAGRLKVKADYSGRSWKSLNAELSRLLENPDGVRKVPKALAKYCIRFVIVEHLPKTRIDGACFWLDKQSPVIAMSLRYDRIDAFWFTLCHELGHIKLRHKAVVDSDVGEIDIGRDKPNSESEADTFAADCLVDQKALDGFIKQHGPKYSKRDIQSFAAEQRVHPGIIVGQLHHRGAVPYSNFRGMLLKIRDFVTPCTLTDGWGCTISDI